MENNFSLSNRKNYWQTRALREIPWLAVCLFIMLPHNLVLDSHQGLDNSWNISISLALQKGMIFGKDYIFTYGPLGALAVRKSLFYSKWVILVFDLFILGTTLFMLLFGLRKSQYNLAAYTFIPLLALLMKFDWMTQYLTPIFIFFIGYTLFFKNKISLLVSFLTAVIGFYVKVNYGIVLILFFHLALVFAFIQKLFPRVLLLATMALLWLLLIGMGYLLHVDIQGYVYSSLHLINAYNDAMYVPIQMSDIHFMTASLISISFGMIFLWQYKYFLEHKAVLLLYLFSAAYMYLIFKNGFVRSDDHRFEYFQQCAIPFAFLYLWTEKKFKTTMGFATCFIALLAFSVSVTSEWYGRTHALKTVYINDIFQDLSHKSTLIVDGNIADTIPARYVQVIGNAPVDIIPWEVSEINRYGLNYNPRPVVQSYSAYDKFLDDCNSNKYASATAPNYLLFSSNAIDHRYPFWDESETKRTILTHYEVVADTAWSEQDQYFLLKKRNVPLKLEIVSEKKIQLQLGEEYSFDSSSLQYLYPAIRYNLRGTIRRFLFQPPALQAQITFEDGSKEQYKAVIPVMASGILVNKKIVTTLDARLFFEHQGKRNVAIKSIKFTGDPGIVSEIEATVKSVQLITP